MYISYLIEFIPFSSNALVSIEGLKPKGHHSNVLDLHTHAGLLPTNISYNNTPNDLDLYNKKYNIFEKSIKVNSSKVQSKSLSETLSE